MPPKAKHWLTRFWSKVPPTTPEQCMEWLGGCDKDGYGRLSRAPIGPKRAHRIVWEMINGPIPNGLCVLHTCDNPRCVNINHLWLGTNKDNTQDMMKKGRAGGYVNRGTNNGRAKYSEDTVREIKKQLTSGLSPKDISEIHNIPLTTIKGIKNGPNWRWLDAK